MDINYAHLIEDYKFYENSISTLKEIYARFRDDIVGKSELLLRFRKWDGNYRFMVTDRIDAFCGFRQHSKEKYLKELLNKYNWWRDHTLYWFRDYSTDDDLLPTLKIDESIESDYLLCFLQDIDFIMNHISDLLTLDNQIFNLDSKKNRAEDDFLKIFFKPENDLLPPEDYIRFDNLIYSTDKKVIDIKKEPWKILAVLMVWAENDKLDLSEFNHVKKSKEVNVRVAHFMAKYFTYEGKERDNTYYNSDIFPLITTKLGAKHEDFIKQLDFICGKIGFNLPQKIKIQP